MSTELTPQQRFEEKVRDRLRENIGDLIPDDVLSKMIQDTMQKLFFHRPMVDEGDRWNKKMVEKPSWFENEVREQTEKMLRPLVLRHVAEAIEEKREDIDVAVAAVVQGGIAQAFFNSIERLYRDPLSALSLQMWERTEKIREHLGQYPDDFWGET